VQVAQPTVAAAPIPPDCAPATERQVTLRLLNGFELRSNGERVAVPLPGQRLLAFLALQVQPVLRPYVAGVLWLNSSEEHAAASLRSALWRLRRPGFDLVESNSQTLSLAAGVDVDVRHAVAWAQRIATSDTALDPSDLEWAPSFGELLPDWYDDWLMFERERIRQLGLHALDRLCERLTGEGRYAEALDIGLAAVRCEPLRASAHRAVIQVHLAEGNRAEAVRQFRIFARVLQEQLGSAPPADVEALVARI
jgi:DNA-binding SARP family transcriptional activator